MKILITGATGFVGRNLYTRLVRSHDIYVLSRESSDTSDLAPVHEYVFKGNVQHLADYLRDERIDGVIHLATKYVAEHSGDHIKDLILANIYLGTAILEAASKAEVRWFLNVGTIWQNYNSPDYSDEYNPVNLYAATKQAFMTIAKFYTETTNIRFCTLKLCDTYGPGDNRRKIMDLFADIAKSGQTLDMSKGEQLIDIVRIDEVVKEFEKLIELLNNPASQLRDEYVVTSGKQISLRNIAEIYERDNNVNLKINWGGRPYRNREVMHPYKGTRVPDFHI